MTVAIDARAALLMCMMVCVNSDFVSLESLWHSEDNVDGNISFELLVLLMTRMWNGPQRPPTSPRWHSVAGVPHTIARNSLVGPTWPVVVQAAPIRCGEGPFKLLWGVAVAVT